MPVSTGGGTTHCTKLTGTARIVIRYPVSFVHGGTISSLVHYVHPNVLLYVVVESSVRSSAVTDLRYFVSQCNKSSI